MGWAQGVFQFPDDFVFTMYEFISISFSYMPSSCFVPDFLFPLVQMKSMLVFIVPIIVIFFSSKYLAKDICVYRSILILVPLRLFPFLHNLLQSSEQVSGSCKCVLL